MTWQYQKRILKLIFVSIGSHSPHYLSICRSISHFANLCIPFKTNLLRPDNQPWHDNGPRTENWKRDTFKDKITSSRKFHFQTKHKKHRQCYQHYTIGRYKCFGSCQNIEIKFNDQTPIIQYTKFYTSPKYLIFMTIMGQMSIFRNKLELTCKVLSFQNYYIVYRFLFLVKPWAPWDWLPITTLCRWLNKSH